MKIAYLANIIMSQSRGQAVQVFNMAKAFQENGHALTLVLPKSPKNKTSKIAEIFYNQKDLPFKIKTVPVVKFNNILRSLTFSLFSLTTKVDLIYTRSIITAFIFSFFKKTILEIHYLPKGITGKLHVLLSKKINHIVVVTQGLKEQYVEAGIKQENIFIAHDAVDLELFDAIKQSSAELREKLNLPQDKKIITFVGAFQLRGKDKGVKNLINSLKHLPEDYILCLIGETPEIIEQYKKYAPESRVIFTGQINREQVPLYCKASDILALPLVDSEDFGVNLSPLKLFEYMASQKPIVASKLKAIEEILTDQKKCFIIQQ